LPKARRRWFDKLTTNGIENAGYTNGVENSDYTNGTENADYRADHLKEVLAGGLR
jgi:hypothetical protein